jgi:hypothetical protein
MVDSDVPGDVKICEYSFNREGAFLRVICTAKKRMRHFKGTGQGVYKEMSSILADQ